MKIVITQPNYLPWLGYFGQLNSCDLWVALDDVQYSRREWQNRNRVLDLSGELQYLSLPIRKTERSSLINQILLSSEFHPGIHLRKIKTYYRNSRFFESVFPFIEEVIQSSYVASDGYLAKLNILIISKVCEYLDLSCDMVRSSELALPSANQSATEKLLQIAMHLRANSYLSSIGAKSYMNPELHLFQQESIEVLWQQFNHISYEQSCRQGEFVSHLSFIDYLFNCGFDGFKSYLNACHQESSSC